MSYLKFDQTNLSNLHFFTKHINFPIVIATYNSWEETQVSYLYNSIQEQTSTSICKWCINHNIQYQILYPLRKIQVLKNPYMFYKYLQLKRMLKNYIIFLQKEKDQK